MSELSYRRLGHGEIIKPVAASTRELALKAENAVFEALALSGEPISKDTETWLNAASMLLRRAIESI
jgi:hypothetical protein